MEDFINPYGITEQQEQQDQTQDDLDTPLATEEENKPNTFLDAAQGVIGGVKEAYTLGTLGDNITSAVAAPITAGIKTLVRGGDYADNVAKDFHDIKQMDSLKPFEAQTTAGNLTYLFSKYASLPGNSLKAGAIADTLLYEEKEGHILHKDIEWDDNYFNIVDRAENAIEGLVGASAAKFVIGKLSKIKPIKDKAELTEVINQALDEHVINETADDLITKIGTDPTLIDSFLRQLPYEDAMRVKEVLEAKLEKALLDTDASDGMLQAGAVELKPYQMTKEEFRDSLQGQHMIEFDDGSKFIGKDADKALDDTVTQVWNERGWNKADNETDKEWMSRVISQYKNKWGNTDLDVKVGIQDLKNKAGKVEIIRDPEGNITGAKLVLNKNNQYPNAAFRHELEHLHDILTGKVPEGDVHFSRYGDEDTFAADYVHKKNVTKALRAGQELPDTVKAQYADVISNIEKHVEGSGSLVKNEIGINTPKAEEKALIANPETPPIKLADEDQLKLDELNNQLKALDDPKYFEQKLRESGYPVDTVKGYEEKIKTLEAEYNSMLEKSSKGNSKRLRLKREEIDKYKAELKSIKRLNTTHSNVASQIKAEKSQLRKQINTLTKQATKRAELKLAYDTYKKTPEAKQMKAKIVEAGEDLSKTNSIDFVETHGTENYIRILASTAEDGYNPFAKETWEEAEEKGLQLLHKLQDEGYIKNVDDVIKQGKHTTLLQAQNRHFAVSVAHTLAEASKKVQKLSEQFSTLVDGTQKAQLMSKINKLTSEVVQLDGVLKGWMSNAGRDLNFTKYLHDPEGAIQKSIQYNSKLHEVAIIKPIGEDVVNSFRENLQTSIQSLFAQAQGVKLSPDMIKQEMIKALGGDLSKHSHWLDTEALNCEAKRLFDLATTPEEAKNLVDEAVRNITYWKRTKEQMLGISASGKTKGMADAIRKNLWNNLSTYYVMNILSAPTTAMKNLTAGIVKTYWDTASKGLGALSSLDKDLMKLTALEFGRMGNNFWKAWGIAWDAMKSGEAKFAFNHMTSDIPGITDDMTSQLKRPKVFSKEAWGLTKENLGANYNPVEIENNAFVKLTGVLGEVADYLSRGMMGTDEFLSSWNYLNKAEALANREAMSNLAIRNGGKYTSDELLKETDRIMKTKYVTDVGTPLHSSETEGLLKESREASLTNRISKEEANSSLNYYLTDKINEITADKKFAKFVVPFTNALSRLTQAGIDSTALGFIPQIGTFHHEIAQGGARAATAKGRMILGHLGLGISTYLGYLGTITGSPPADKAERDALYARGWKPYSILINGKYVSYKNFEPAATVLGLGADLGNNLHHLNDQDVNKLLTSFSGSLAQNILDKSFFHNLGLQLSLINPANWDNDNVAYQLGSTLSASVIPGSSFVRWGGDLVDTATSNVLREPRGIMDSFLSGAIPFYKATVPAKLNDLGEEIKATPGPVSLVSTKVLGVPVNEIKDSPLDDELLRLAQFGLKLPKPVTDISGVHLLEYRNDNGMTAYEAIHRKKGSLTIDGKTLRESLTELIDSDYYKELPDGGSEEYEGFTRTYTSSWTKKGALQDIYQKYLNEAAYDVMNSDEFKNTETGVPIVQDVNNRYYDKDPYVQLDNKKPSIGEQINSLFNRG